MADVIINITIANVHDAASVVDPCWRVILQHPGATEAGLMHMLDYSQRHGNRVHGFWFGPFRPIARLVHSDTLKLILRTAEPKVLSSGGYRHLMPWLGNSISESNLRFIDSSIFVRS